MAVLSVQNLDMEFGERTLFSGVSFEVGERDKIGFIGSNATGKTTLFKLITGELEPTLGGVYPGKNIKIGYLEQHACAGSQKTVYDEMESVFEPLMKKRSGSKSSRISSKRDMATLTRSSPSRTDCTPNLRTRAG